MTKTEPIAAKKLPVIPRPGRVLLTTPDYFQVRYVINPHMEGNIGDVDPETALQQWDVLRNTYDRLGFEVHVLKGREDLPDMVFCANQTLPYTTPGGDRGAIVSRMHAEQRKPEVDAYAEFFENRDYEVQTLDADLPGDFEGMGDAIWHPGRYLLWGAYGYRTDKEVYRRFAIKLGFPVLSLQLLDPDFYHLDTCLTPLDEDTAMFVPTAFDKEGIEQLETQFHRLIDVPEDEARSLLACNAHCPDAQHVIIQSGCEETSKRIEKAGYEVVEVDTSEFLKSGGSVYCMKLMFW